MESMNTITIRFWGITARLAGAEQRVLQLSAGARVADAVEHLRQDAALSGELPRCAYAVGDDMVGLDHPLADGDELSVLPPVSGG